jgi:hypothetical protein
MTVSPRTVTFSRNEKHDASRTQLVTYTGITSHSMHISILETTGITYNLYFPNPKL